LAAAAYYVRGENVVERRGLGYSNQDVVLYVASVRERKGMMRNYRLI
jgi:hypothetical protein